MQFEWNGRLYSGFQGPNGQIYRSFDELAASPWFKGLLRDALDRQRAAMPSPALRPKKSVLERAFEREMARIEAEAEAAHWQRCAQIATLKRHQAQAATPEEKLRFLLQRKQLETTAQQPAQTTRELLSPVTQQAGPAGAARRLLERLERLQSFL